MCITSVDIGKNETLSTPYVENSGQRVALPVQNPVLLVTARGLFTVIKASHKTGPCEAGHLSPCPGKEWTPANLARPLSSQGQPANITPGARSSRYPKSLLPPWAG